MSINLKSSLPNPSALLMAYWMPWQGDPKRVSHVTYNQTDLAVCDRQLDCMKAANIDGVIAVWQGPTRNPYTHDSYMEMFYACLKRGIPFLTLLDQWIAKGLADPTGAVITALTTQPFVGIHPFMAERFVLEFDLGPSAGVDMTKVRAAVPSFSILSKHVGYSWPEITNTMQVLAADNANPAMLVPCVFAGFDDGGYPLPGGVGSPAGYVGQRDYNKSVWGGGNARRIDGRIGQTFLDSCAMVPPTAKYVGLVTWNDWDEGTAIEGECAAATGIRIG